MKKRLKELTVKIQTEEDNTSRIKSNEVLDLAFTISISIFI